MERDIPKALAGENIPIGARILAAVDCLDALASHRQYRPALPLGEAMTKVEEKSGTWFDPQVVEILLKSYIELERMAQMTEDTAAPHGLSKSVRVERGLAPATGFERSDPTHGPVDNADFLTSIASARQEAQTMFELSQDLGISLSLSETLSVLSMRLRRMIPYDSIAVFVNRNGWLLPELVSGENFRMLSSLKVRVGEGLCGWVAENCKPIINGNPQVEAGYMVDLGKHSTLQSALVVPLEGLNGVVGVLAMYHVNRDAFTPDHLRILLAVASKVALSVENALKYQQAESSATTDYLTGLPNARSLFVHLAQEVARCRRMKSPLAVLVCDIDGFKAINDSFGHSGGRQAAARVQHASERSLPRLRLRRAHGRRRICDYRSRTYARGSAGKSRAIESGGHRIRTACVRPRSDHSERRHGILSGRWIRRRTAAGRGRPPHVLHEAAPPRGICRARGRPESARSQREIGESQPCWRKPLRGRANSDSPH